MSKADNLNDFLLDIANAIRIKKGTTAPINAQDFSKEILSIQTSVDSRKEQILSFVQEGTNIPVRSINFYVGSIPEEDVSTGMLCSTIKEPLLIGAMTDVTYSSDTVGVNANAQTGKISIVINKGKPWQSTITATAQESDEYHSATASYIINCQQMQPASYMFNTPASDTRVNIIDAQNAIITEQRFIWEIRIAGDDEFDYNGTGIKLYKGTHIKLTPNISSGYHISYWKLVTGNNYHSFAQNTINILQEVDFDFGSYFSTIFLPKDESLPIEFDTTGAMRIARIEIYYYKE